MALVPQEVAKRRALKRTFGKKLGKLGKIGEHVGKLGKTWETFGKFWRGALRFELMIFLGVSTALESLNYPLVNSQFDPGSCRGWKTSFH